MGQIIVEMGIYRQNGCRRNGTTETFWCRRNESSRNGSRRNGKIIVETGKGKMGVGKMGTNRD